MDAGRFVRHLDYVLLAVVLALVGYSGVMVYLATRDDPGYSPTHYVVYQLAFAGVGLVLMAFIALVDYERYRRWQWLLWGFAVFSIGAVFVIGPLTRGTHRWLHFSGGFNFQPSELAIWLLAVALAAFLVDRLDSLGSKRLTVMALAYVAAPAAMVFLQPDLGTSTVLVMMGVGLLFFFGTRWTHFAAILAVVVAAGVLVFAVMPAFGFHHVLNSYQMDRLTVFLHPNQGAPGSGYNIKQSLIAVGSGGLTGRGSMSTQTSLQFLPEHHTDFIFAVVGERWGFVGSGALILLYALLVWRALRITTMARDMYGSVIAGGIATVFLYQVLVNVGMTLGIMPVTGIPLPFISYGGAALITNLMLIGLLQSIHVRARDALAARERVL